MKFIIEQKLFYGIIQDVQRAMATHTTVSNLTGILVIAKDNKLIVAATDLEIRIESETDCEILKEGKIVLPGVSFSSIIRELPQGEITFTLDEFFNAQIDCFNSHYTIKGYDPEEYPTLPEIKSDFTVNISQALFKRMVDEVKFAASNDENQPFLHGALLTIAKSGKIELAATNLYRLALREIVVTNTFDFEEDIKIIIPLKTLNELSRLLTKEGEVQIKLGGNHLFFSFSNLLILSRLKEGQFPGYRLIIPANFNSICTINRDNLLNAVRRASLLADKDTNTINFSFEKQELELTNRGTKMGHACEIIPCQLEGPEVDIAFTADYVVDVLRVIASDLVTISIVDARNACIIRDAQDPDYTYLLMPMQI